jgi:sulfatase maturation enzyme AslB (radical SAM superfamily)
MPYVMGDRGNIVAIVWAVTVEHQVTGLQRAFCDGGAVHGLLAGVPRPPDAVGAVAVCHLDCTYCFFLFKELLYPGSRFRMADDLLEAYLRQLIEAHARAVVT